LTQKKAYTHTRTHTAARLDATHSPWATHLDLALVVGRGLERIKASEAGGLAGLVIPLPAAYEAWDGGLAGAGQSYPEKPGARARALGDEPCTHGRRGQVDRGEG